MIHNVSTKYCCTWQPWTLDYGYLGVIYSPKRASRHCPFLAKRCQNWANCGRTEPVRVPLVRDLIDTFLPKTASHWCTGPVAGSVRHGLSPIAGLVHHGPSTIEAM